MVASHHVPNIGNAITPLTMGPIGTTLGWSRPSNTSAAKPFPWYLVVTAEPHSERSSFMRCTDQKTSTIFMKLG